MTGAESLCQAESWWPGVTCQRTPHVDDHHFAEDERSDYVWSTAGVEAAKRGECPACRRRVCVCPCSCPGCSARKAASR